MLTRTLFAPALAFAILGVTLTGCIHPYTPAVQQGNVITENEITQLHLGMSKDQVQYLIGTPVLVDDLNTDEWDYVYTYQPSASKPMQEQTLTLIFKNNMLTAIDGQQKALGKL